jgi:hypothetical protein
MPYYFRVRARNAAGYSADYAYCNNAVAEPSIPQNIQCTNISSTEVAVEWDTVQNATHYIVEYSENANFSPNISDTLPYGTTSKNFTNLTPGMQHYFRVIARNSAGYAADYAYCNKAVVQPSTSNLQCTLVAPRTIQAV